MLSQAIHSEETVDEERQPQMWEKEVGWGGGEPLLSVKCFDFFFFSSSSSRQPSEPHMLMNYTLLYTR